MKLRALRLHNVRRFAARGVAVEGIEDGVNVLAEANEHGKSTCFDALHALFFESYKSRKKDVQSLRPYSGGAVLIEADVEEGGSGYRLRKRYYGSAMAQVVETGTGRIVAQADEAERWIAERIQGGAGGPAGLLWVQQGVVEMNSRAKAVNEEEKAAREDVLTSVSGEIETLTGGKRTSQVLNACQSELDRLVTATGKPKAGGPYAAALAEHEALDNEIAELSERVAALRGDLEHRKTARKRLAELQDPEIRARETAALRDAEAALKQAEDHDSSLKAAELAERLAAQEHQSAEQTLERFEKAVQALAALDQRAATEAEQEDAAKRAFDDARAGETAAADAARKAREAFEAAESSLERSRKAALAREARRHLDRLRKTLAAAESARTMAETARSEADALALPKGGIEALEELDDRIETLSAELRASSLSVEVSYADPAVPAIRRDGEALAQGVPVTATDPLRLDIDGVGSLTIRPGSGGGAAGLARQLAETRSNRVALLARLGVDSLAAAKLRNADSEARRLIERENRTRLDTLAPDGLDALRQQVAALEHSADETVDAAEMAKELETKRDAAREERAAAEAKLTEARSVLAAADKRLAGLSQSLNRTRGEQERQQQALGDPSAREPLLEILRQKQGAFEEKSQAADALRRAAPDLETLRAAHARAASVISRSEQEAVALENRISELNGGIRSRAEEGIEESLSEHEGKRASVAARVVALEAEVATLRKLLAVLTDAKTAAKEHFFDPIVREMKPLLDIVFEDASISFDETTLLPVTVERGGQEESFEVLSGGMREQVTILTRLAFARLLAKGGRPVPVILDDALIYSDDDRIERMFTALHRQASDLQILVLTCRQRAFHALGGSTLKMTAWEPEL